MTPDCSEVAGYLVAAQFLGGLFAILIGVAFAAIAGWWLHHPA